MELETFRGVVPFVAVAEEGNFRRAATRLGVTPAAVSKAVAALEVDLGHALFQRTTRAVSLTRQGQLFFERCRQALASVRGAREALAGTRAEPSGALVVSVPFVVVPLLVPALALLSSRFPKLTFDVRVTDALSRFAEESIDVAVRVGALAESSLVARRLRRTSLVTVASPAYLARHGTPTRPAHLKEHRCLVLRAPNNKPWPFLLAGGPLPLEGGLLVDNGPALLECALVGLGVTQAFDFMVAEPLREGRLVELFPSSRAEGPDIHAVCAPGRRASANVRAAFGALAEAFSRSGP